MKSPRFIKIHFPENKPFDIVKVVRPYFVVPWHFHPEIEIMLITQGSGTRFVGDSIESFEPLDLAMIGPNLAHVWKNGQPHFTQRAAQLAEATYIVFRLDSFGKDFFNLPELASIKALIERSQSGLKFHGATRLAVAEQILAAHHETGVAQFLMLLEILRNLAKSDESTTLCSATYRQRVDASDLHRLDSVLDYLMMNYRNEVKLEEVANIANMSLTAFCRYFKDRTNKTVIQFLNEIRIEHAHKMLTETTNTVEQISTDCGFKNVSNFYQQFQKITGKSPLKFRKEHKERIFLGN